MQLNVISAPRSAVRSGPSKRTVQLELSGLTFAGLEILFAKAVARSNDCECNSATWQLGNSATATATESATATSSTVQIVTAGPSDPIKLAGQSAYEKNLPTSRIFSRLPPKDRKRRARRTADSDTVLRCDPVQPHCAIFPPNLALNADQP